MRGTSSAPAARVLEVVELLTQTVDARLRFVDVARELDITQATAHSILKTLCDKGWATRDPIDKSFRPGPALAAVAARADASRPLARAARLAANELTAETGYPASVIERTGDHLVITAFEGGELPHPAGIPGDRIPYAAPFGVAFAAWDPVEEQRAWVDRAPVPDTQVAQRLYRILAETRARGFDIDRMTPALARAARMLESVHNSGIPDHVRNTLEQLRAEFTTIGFPDPRTDARSLPIATISAPVIDRDERAVLILGIHPLRALSTSRVDALGHRLTAATTSLSAQPDSP